VSIRKTIQIKKLSINIIGFIFLSSLINVQANQIFDEEKIPTETSYLQSRNELEDYILDTGDILNIKFKNTPELSGQFTINDQGEIYFDRIKNAYVRGLTIKELKVLIEKRYSNFLINPEINIRHSRFKAVRVSVKGEVRRPGLISFAPFFSAENSNFQRTRKQNQTVFMEDIKTGANVLKDDEFVNTISNALNKVGGLTPYSDVSKIEIIRDVPIGKGGGKKKAIVDFTDFLKNSNKKLDLRLFDGDIIFVPSLEEPNPNTVRLSILSGLSPRFISINVLGQIENPGEILVPFESSVSDAMDLSGPRMPLSGKIILIRYNQDGSLIRKKINYSSKAKPGTKRNPTLVAGDLIAVTNSVLGRTSGTLKALTDPFLGIYTTKEFIKDFKGD
tara:strand:+ start:70 stop:1239 length:1170 start_codon:yes stop_codon:yes gene_type:complete